MSTSGEPWVADARRLVMEPISFTAAPQPWSLDDDRAIGVVIVTGLLVVSWPAAGQVLWLVAVAAAVVLAQRREGTDPQDGPVLTGSP